MDRQVVTRTVRLRRRRDNQRTPLHQRDLRRLRGTRVHATLARRSPRGNLRGPSLHAPTIGTLTSACCSSRSPPSTPCGQDSVHNDAAGRRSRYAGRRSVRQPARAGPERTDLGDRRSSRSHRRGTCLCRWRDGWLRPDSGSNFPRAIHLRPSRDVLFDSLEPPLGAVSPVRVRLNERSRFVAAMQGDPASRNALRRNSATNYP